jgi:tetratricopeptide (TPR) repeat protein
VLEHSGKLVEAQQALTEAATISPHNTLRQRVVGDIAVRNGDLNTAERAYQTALNRSRGSSISSTDDYANLSRVLIRQNKAVQARNVAQELRRERKLDRASEVAALTIDSLAYQSEGNEVAARNSLNKALGTRDGMDGLSDKLTVDLAHAALAIGESATANELLRQVIAENPDDLALHQMVESAYARVGNAGSGTALVEAVGKEIIQINNQGVLLARAGDFEGSVNLLAQAAEQMPNIQFLVNASNASFTLIDRKGWQQDIAERGLGFLLRAEQKDPKHPKVINAYDFFQSVAQKYGIAVKPLRSMVLEGSRRGKG